MRKAIVTIALLLLLSALCSIDQGSVNLGGTLSYTNFRIDENATIYSVFTFSPQIGYFLRDNMAANLILGLGSITQDHNTTTETSMGLGGKYIYKNWYGGLSAQVDNYTSVLALPEFKRSAKYGSAQAGYLIPVSSDTYVDLGLHYKFGFGRYGGDRRDDFNREREFGFQAGLQYFFGWKCKTPGCAVPTPTGNK